MLSENDIVAEYGRIDYAEVTKAFFIYNDIMLHINNSEGLSPENVLEIGPGTGGLLRLLKKFHPSARIVAVDLPSSIPYSFCNLLYRYPEAKFCLPNEVGGDTDFTKDNFVFLTNEQTGFLEANQFDIGVNTMSFAEMKQSHIAEYFRLLRRVLKKENLFYCMNAVEKPMIYDGRTVPIRFFEYPWSPEDKDYKYELSPVEQGRTYKPFYVRAVKLAVSHS